MLPEKIRSLAVSIGDEENAGQLLKASIYEFRYLSPDPEQPMTPMHLLAPIGRNGVGRLGYSLPDAPSPEGSSSREGIRARRIPRPRNSTPLRTASAA